jgi:ABC-2 type transport system ATP-binding protein
VDPPLRKIHPGDEDSQARRGEDPVTGNTTPDPGGDPGTEVKGAAMNGSEAARTNPAMGVETVVSVRGLTKRYGTHEAVRGIDLEVRKGEIFAFLGPNGAGKTTTVEILEGFRRRTSGEVAVLGVDPQEATAAWRNRIGVVLQDSEPEPGLSVRECLRLYAGYYTSPRDVDETIELVGLKGRGDALGSDLSGGQRRRLDVAMALIGDPELIFLDEPTTGFDPSARRAAWEVIAGLRTLGKTVFLTTHFMDEAEYLADRITVMTAGQIVASGTPHTLGGRDRMTAAITFTLPPTLSLRDMPSGLRPLAETGESGTTCLRSESPLVHLQMLAEWALSSGSDLSDIEVRRPSLEDVYLALTEGALHAAGQR